MKPNTSWDEAADWYDNYLSATPDSYQRQVILPNLLRLLDLKRGEPVLDLACGSGFFSREFARAGAEVLGVDLSPKLIKLAQTKPMANLKYQVSAAEKLVAVPEQSFTKVVCVLALQNMSEVKKIFQEVKRVLRPAGQLFLVLNHPAFRVPGQSVWGWDELKQLQYRRLEAYLSESKMAIQTHPGQAPRETTTSFHRPLQYYFKLLESSGLAVTRLEEWISHRRSQPGPRGVAEDRARHEFPLFLFLAARVL